MKDTFITPQLIQQIDSLINSLKTFSQKSDQPIDPKNYIFLQDFYRRFFSDRNKRSVEVESAEYKEIIAFANSQFPAMTLWNLCMDGRVLAVLLHGASAKVGSSIRTPAGIFHEFVRGKNGKYSLLENSNFASLLEKALRRSKTKKVYEVFDSHIGCAARNAEQLARGIKAKDSGLFADVMHKKIMGEAVVAFVKKYYKKLGTVVPLQTSFDPSNGFIFMGLETDRALAYARERGEEYTSEVLEELVKKGIIISAQGIVQNEQIQKLFNEHVFVLDWKKNYVHSTKMFWENIAAMKDTARPLFKEIIIGVYPHLVHESNSKNSELEERFILLLTNAYSGFLNNKYYEQDMHNLDDEVDRYLYGSHREEGVKVSEGGHPPYDISMFVVFSNDTKNLPGHIELASSLVRNNRYEGKVIDRSKTFTDPYEFSKAVVPVVVQVTIRDSIDDKEWIKLSKLSWSDLSQDWNLMSDKEFFHYMQKKGDINIAVANGINRLREKMAVLYDIDQPVSAHLIEQYKVAVPVVIGSNKRNYFIVPFVKLGY